MGVDIFVISALGGAFYLGYSKGVLHALFSAGGLLLGTIVALKYALPLSQWLTENYSISPSLIPFVAFITLFITGILLIKLVSSSIEKFMKSMNLKFVDKLVGGTVWTLFTAFIVSAILFFVNQAGFISPELKTSSITYNIVTPLFSVGLDFFGMVLPSLKEIPTHFKELYNQLPG